MSLPRFLILAASAIAVSCALVETAAAQASTIRIEPRQVYGATITKERGVRVWRSLPATSHVIINPGNRTPINLSLADVRETHTTHNYNEGGAAVAGGDGDYYPGGYYGGRFLRGHRFARHPGHRHHAHHGGGRGGRGGHR